MIELHARHENKILFDSIKIHENANIILSHSDRKLYLFVKNDSLFLTCYIMEGVFINDDTTVITGKKPLEVSVTTKKVLLSPLKMIFDDDINKSFSDIPLTNISFTKKHPLERRFLSSVDSGNIYIYQTNKTIQVHKNDFVSFGKIKKLEVCNIEEVDGLFKIYIEGKVSSLRIGKNSINYINNCSPRLIEYFYSNPNIGLIVAFCGFIIGIFKIFK